MHDLRRLLKYLRPHWLKFTLATFAMILGGLLETAVGALVVPILDQAFATAGQGHKGSTLFGLQHLIPESGIGAWRTIAVLLILFTAVKGIFLLISWPASDNPRS
jgi:ABC-type multidrug transport system fused ATPase/permease subunit